MTKDECDKLPADEKVFGVRGNVRPQKLGRSAIFTKIRPQAGPAQRLFFASERLRAAILKEKSNLP